MKITNLEIKEEVKDYVEMLVEGLSTNKHDYDAELWNMLTTDSSENVVSFLLNECLDYVFEETVVDDEVKDFTRKAFIEELGNNKNYKELGKLVEDAKMSFDDIKEQVKLFVDLEIIRHMENLDYMSKEDKEILLEADEEHIAQEYIYAYNGIIDWIEGEGFLYLNEEQIDFALESLIEELENNTNFQEAREKAKAIDGLKNDYFTFLELDEKMQKRGFYSEGDDALNRIDELIEAGSISYTHEEIDGECNIEFKYSDISEKLLITDVYWL